MDGSRRGDPLDELRRANPVGPDDLPSANLARVRATVMGELTPGDEHPSMHRRRAGRRTLGFGLAGLIAAAAVAVGVLQPGPGAGVPDRSSGVPQIGICVEPYELETLGHRTFAFEGTVVAVTHDTATFKVETPFKGVATGDITLTATGMTGGVITPGGGVTLVPGERYLVAGDGTFAWGCGFTQPYEPALAAQWAAALGR